MATAVELQQKEEILQVAEAVEHGIQWGATALVENVSFDSVLYGPLDIYIYHATGFHKSALDIVKLSLYDKADLLKSGDDNT